MKVKKRNEEHERTIEDKTEKIKDLNMQILGYRKKISDL